MTTSRVSQLILWIQSGLNLKAFARLFFISILTLLLHSTAFALQLKDKKPQDFKELSILLTQEPFWHKKAVWEAMVKERKIPVSVIRENAWSFKGAGIARVPRPFSVEKAKEFNRLSQIPEYMPEVTFDPEKSLLHLKINFLGQVRPLDLELFEENLEIENRIFFRSQGPWLQGLEGAVSFKDHERQATEIGLFAQYSGEIGWVPNWIFSVATEAVMHHAAEQLRKGLESDYKN